MKRQGRKSITMVLVALLVSTIGFADNSSADQSNSATDASTQAAIQQLLQSANSAQSTANQNNDATAASTTADTTNTAANNSAATPTAATHTPSLNDQAFAQTVHNMLPLTPDQIKTLRYLLDESQRAAAEYPGTPPRPTSSLVAVNLSPGATPPVERLCAGYVTSLVFTDATGSPWPVAAYDLGNPHDFNVQWNKKGNTLLVQALDHYQAGNLAVMLQGMDTPIMVTLLPGQRACDYRTDLRIPQLGPNANPVFSGLPNTANPKLLDVLDGVPPQGAQQLQIQGGNATAWLIDNHIFLRTPLTVLSPGWISATSSSDGTNAYELPNTPVILASSQGQIIKLIVQES